MKRNEWVFIFKVCIVQGFCFFFILVEMDVFMVYKLIYLLIYLKYSKSWLVSIYWSLLLNRKFSVQNDNCYGWSFLVIVKI